MSLESIMSNKLSATLLSGWKYAFYTALSAGILAGVGALDHTSIPLWAVPLLGTVLKGLATWFSTEANKP